MGRFSGSGKQDDGVFSDANPGTPDALRPVAEWVGEMRSRFIEPIPEEAARYQAALAAETARLATETRRTTAATRTARQGAPARSELTVKRNIKRLVAQLGIAFVALVLVAGAAAAASGVDVGGIITSPFRSHTPVVDESSTTTSPDPGTVDDDDQGEIDDSDDQGTVDDSNDQGNDLEP